MSPEPSAPPLGQSRSLRQRAGEWFGESNIASMVAVPLGRRKVAFIDGTRLWLYSERTHASRPDSLVVRLTPKMREDLIAALTEADPSA